LGSLGGVRLFAVDLPLTTPCHSEERSDEESGDVRRKHSRVFRFLSFRRRRGMTMEVPEIPREVIGMAVGTFAQAQSYDTR
jgi:hypothetical protein